MAYRRYASQTSGARVLDAGCGTGGLLARLDGPQSAVGIDADAEACTRAAAKSGCPVCAGSVDALPFAEAAFTAILTADVLCHRGVDERRALAQFHRCLGAGGILVLNLPAYRWMMSRHDAAVYNVRRYTKRGVVALLRAAGFRPLFVSYWNMLLFPLMVLTRKLLPGGGSDVHEQPGWVEAIGRAATGTERLLIGAGITLPFGGSVLAVAAKIESGHA
ncbi:MAG TPA: class I SAM-dependent methyltransferase [Stellaceae bacterium]|nr:class I SAM-dependent methyltransferase [Stellaceae bacterium]